MKLSSAIFATLTGLSLLAIFPFLAALLNIYLGLPVVHSQILKHAGFVLLASGILGVAYCAALFSRFGKGTPIPVAPPKKLVIAGIYKYTRNPIYIAYAMIFLSEFLILGYSLLLAYFFISLLLLQLHVVYVEEPALKKRFGKSYAKYLKEVPRWIF